MAVITLICTTCWIVQILRWIISWALKESNASGRHSEDDYVEDDHRTVVQMARLEEKITVESENMRLRTNRLEDGHAMDSCDNNTVTTTTTSKLCKDNVLEQLELYEGNIHYFSDELTALQTKNPKMITNTGASNYLEDINERMDLFYDYGSIVSKELKDFTEKYDALEERINKMEDTYYEGIKRICYAAMEKADLLEGLYDSLTDEANGLKDCTEQLRDKTTMLGINYEKLVYQVDDLQKRYDNDEPEIDEDISDFDESSDHDVYEFDEASDIDVNELRNSLESFEHEEPENY